MTPNVLTSASAELGTRSVTLFLRDWWEKLRGKCVHKEAGWKWVNICFNFHMKNAPQRVRSGYGLILLPPKHTLMQSVECDNEYVCSV